MNIVMIIEIPEKDMLDGEKHPAKCPVVAIKLSLVYVKFILMETIYKWSFYYGLNVKSRTK